MLCAGKPTALGETSGLIPESGRVRQPGYSRLRLHSFGEPVPQSSRPVMQQRLQSICGLRGKHMDPTFRVGAADQPGDRPTGNVWIDLQIDRHRQSAVRCGVTAVVDIATCPTNDFDVNEIDVLNTARLPAWRMAVALPRLSKDFVRAVDEFLAEFLRHTWSPVCVRLVLQCQRENFARQLVW